MGLTPDIIEVRALDGYNLYLKFKNGEEKIFNMTEHVDKIKYFYRLKNKDYFKRVTPRGDTIEWENGEDVAPENLYNKSVSINEYNGNLD